MEGVSLNAAGSNMIDQSHGNYTSGDCFSDLAVQDGSIHVVYFLSNCSPGMLHFLDLIPSKILMQANKIA